YTVYGRVIDKDNGFTQYSQQVTVSQRALHVTAAAANNVYDGTSTASVTLSDDRLAGDTFTTNYSSATFANANVGTNKTVTVSGISISGGNSADYSLANTTATTTADITAAGTSTALVSWLNPSSVGASVTFMATVTAANSAPIPAGELVTFNEGATTLG